MQSVDKISRNMREYAEIRFVYTFLAARLGLWFKVTPNLHGFGAPTLGVTWVFLVCGRVNHNLTQPLGLKARAFTQTITQFITQTGAP